jgi:hypothetical protein
MLDKKHFKVFDKNKSSSMQLHKCSICGKIDWWSDSWVWYGSLSDYDEGKIIKLCSADCKEKFEQLKRRV